MNINRVPGLRAMIGGVFASITLLGATAAQAQGNQALVDLINAYRAAPRMCEGRLRQPVAALAAHPALARVEVATGTLLEQAIERVGYPVAKAEAIYISGPADARAVMESIDRKYCSTLLNPELSDVGTARSGDSWLIILAQPAPPPAIERLPDTVEAGKAILGAVNLARVAARTCGEKRFPAAPPVTWNAALGEAALVHSRDMARHRYLSHKGKDGREASDRALQAGYQWRHVGENIAAGQSSPDEVVAGWLSSPGHCANIMNSSFTEMGAAYAINRARATGRVYWTQVFAAPR